MSKLTHKIVSLCLQEPKPMQTLAKLTGSPYNTVYSAVKRAENKGLVITKILDGLCWVRARPPTQPLNLLKETQKSNNAKTRSVFDIPQRSGPERRTAIYQTTRGLDIRSVEDKCYEEFGAYLERIDEAEIVLLPNPERNFLGPPLILPYVTRFNNDSRKVEELKKYEHAWDVAAGKHKIAIMITLTTDPKIQKSLWHANRQASGNMNKLISNLTRRFGHRPVYINVNEFQQNGRIHEHIVIFGKNYIMSMEELARLWHKYGQGEVVHFHKLRKDRDRWVWAGQPPKDSKEKLPIDYLKKYLKKGLYNDETNFQYWIYNTRYFTNSRSLGITIIKRTPQGLYVYFGVFYGNIPNFINQYYEIVDPGKPPTTGGLKPGQRRTWEGVE